VGRVPDPATVLGPITATVDRSTPPRPAPRIFWITAVWFALDNPLRIFGAIVAAFASSNEIVDGWNVVPAEVLVFVNT